MFRSRSPYRDADASGLDHFICPRCRAEVSVRNGQRPRNTVCARDGWPLIPLASFEKSDGDPFLGMTLPGGFTLLEAVGAGSSSTVYRASVEPRSTRSRTVPAWPSVAAVKIMRLDGHDQADAMDAWEREVSALERLHAPSIVGLLDSGRITYPASFFVALEWLEGPTLAEISPMSPHDAVTWAYHVANGLSILHGRGFVHGDVKPRNAKRTPRGVTLFDLGSACVENTRQPGFGEPRFRASVAYAAPERILGGRISRAADAYALGATLFQLIAGHAPFRGDAERVAKAQVDTPPPKLLDVARHTPKDDVTASIQGAIDALLTKNVTQRPTDLVALFRALKNRCMEVYGRYPNV